MLGICKVVAIVFTAILLASQTSTFVQAISYTQPVFIRSNLLRPASVNAGGTVYLSCAFRYVGRDGNVSWTRSNNQPLQGPPWQVETTATGNTTVSLLYILGAKPTMAGRYVCTARNRHGTAFGTQLLQVSNIQLGSDIGTLRNSVSVVTSTPAAPFQFITHDWLIVAVAVGGVFLFGVILFAYVSYRQQGTIMQEIFEMQGLTRYKDTSDQANKYTCPPLPATRTSPPVSCTRQSQERNFWHLAQHVRYAVFPSGGRSASRSDDHVMADMAPSLPPSDSISSQVTYSQATSMLSETSDDNLGHRSLSSIVHSLDLEVDGVERRVDGVDQQIDIKKMHQLQHRLDLRRAMEHLQGHAGRAGEGGLAPATTERLDDDVRKTNVCGSLSLSSRLPSECCYQPVDDQADLYEVSMQIPTGDHWAPSLQDNAGCSSQRTHSTDDDWYDNAPDMNRQRKLSSTTSVKQRPRRRSSAPSLTGEVPSLFISKLRRGLRGTLHA